MGGRLGCALLALAAVLIAGCSTPRSLVASGGVKLTPLRSVSKLEARALLALAGVKGVPVSQGADLYRLEREGQSALLALPRGRPARLLVSFQHGTSTSRTAVPSKPDQTGLAAAIAFAGNGYALVAPDYPGLGTSGGRHPYYVAEAEGRSVVAMIEAAQRVPGVPAGSVFLSGFSQGGHVSLAALRILEQGGRPVLGAGLVAGAYDLRRISLPAAMKGNSPSQPLYLAYIAWAYSDRYRQPLDSVLAQGQATVVERLFAANPGQKEIVKALPARPRDLFAPAFLDAYDHGGAHWFLDALAANSLTDLTPRAPVRLYYGSGDLDVTPQESRSAAAAMRARGADASAIDVGPVGHDASMLAAAPLILRQLRAIATD